MPSKLSRYADGVIEAAWIAVIIIVPVFFNVYSSRIFEPDKISLLRTLSLVVLAAWLVKLIEQGGSRWEKLEFDGNFWVSTRKIPILIPVFALTIVYLVATVFSITPRTSFFGSYQRLQGFYTFLSYLVIFGALLGNLRRRIQVERILLAMIISSLPIALYGVIQRYGLDPIPWGGNVTNRIAANMGNSIFVAAYLIMVFPLTVGKVISSIRELLKTQQDVVKNILRATLFIFVAIMQLIGIYLSGSRGPLLGLIASAAIIFILLANHWRLKWLLVATLVISLGIVSFLGVLNIPNGPLEELRSAKWIGRFGQVFNTEERTSQVRALIWEGAADLISPHEPLIFPDGSTDKLNALRPLIGYGLEGMYVAYNPFYPPELAKIEKRNASPDRSHNETWDAVVMTGFLGLVVYLVLFGAIFYWGLRWAGMLEQKKQRLTLLGFITLGGAAGSLILYLWQGIGFLGVGLPFGMMAGLVGYLALSVVFRSSGNSEGNPSQERVILLSLLIGAIAGHFVEIHFGIAIAVTRTYFWVFTALLILVGHILPRYGEYEEQTADAIETAAEELSGTAEPVVVKSHKKKSKPKQNKANQFLGAAIGENVAAIFSLGILLITLGYNYVSNLSRSTSGFEVFANSLTWLPGSGTKSYGVLSLVLFTWVIGAILYAVEPGHHLQPDKWKRNVLLILSGSGMVGFGYWLMQSFILAGLAHQIPTTQQEVMQQIAGFANLPVIFAIVLIGLLLVFAGRLQGENPRQKAGGVGVLLLPVALTMAFAIGYATNLKVIQADVTFKMADSFTRENQWPVSILVYRKAIEQTPNEDHYYLFLGRAYLEYAKTLGDPQEREELMKQAEEDLIKAQAINPLNTDHTANLARLYSWWASTSSEPTVKQKFASMSEAYYEKAVVLSPNNVTLWGEKAILELSQLKNTEKALETLEIAMQVDSEYDRTHALLGDYYSQEARKLEGDARRQMFGQAADEYSKALQYVAKPKENNPARYTYSIALAGVNLELEEYSNAIQAYLTAIDNAQQRDKWRLFEALSRLYSETGEADLAVEYAKKAIGVSPDSEKERLNNYLSTLQNP